MPKFKPIQLKKSNPVAPVAAACPINWGKLTQAEKVVALANDVIAQMRAKKVLPTSGDFGTINLKNGAEKAFSERELDSEIISAKKTLGQMKNCECCALGALFVAKVKLNGDFKLDATADDLEFEKRVSVGFTETKETLKFMGEDVLVYIESLFELGCGATSIDTENIPATHYICSRDSDRFENVLLDLITLVKPRIRVKDKFRLSDYERMTIIMKSLIYFNGDLKAWKKKMVELFEKRGILGTY